MTNAPLVSIIIPTYNRAHLIGETLNSVLEQTYTNWECIVVDDGSTDNTAEVMAIYCTKDARFQYHHRPKDRLPGGNAARNYGFELSKGEYVQWFDSDDVMMPEKIEIKLKLLIKSNSDFVVCKGALFEKLPDLVPIAWPLHLKGNILFNHICGRIAFVTNGPMFNKKFLENRKALFDEKLMVRQEWEFFNRLLILDPIIEIITEPLYLFRTLNSGIRRVFSLQKVKSRILAENLTFKNVYSYKKFNDEEDFYYRKQLMRRVLSFYKPLSFIDRVKLFPVFFKTILLPINISIIYKFISDNKKIKRK